MRFRGAIALALLLGLSACGILGSKPRDAQPISYSPEGLGCLNNLGDKLERFFGGRISPEEWSASWSCTQDTLQTLNDLIAGSQGMNLQQVHDLIAHVLVTNHDIPMDFVQALLELKAGLLGGSPTELSRTEIARTQVILASIQAETSKLLVPLSVKRAPREGLELAGRVQATLDAIHRVFPDDVRRPIGRGTIDTLARELPEILGWPVPANLTALLLSGKQFLAGGSADEIEPGNWSEALNIVAKLAGVAAAYGRVDPGLSREPNEMGEFVYGLVSRTNDALKGSIALHGGAIPLDQVDHVIDAAPAGLTMFRPETIKKVLDAVTRRIFLPRVPRTLDAAVLDQTLAELDQWREGRTLLDRIFAFGSLNPIGVTRDQFVAAARAYGSRRGEGMTPAIDRLIGLAYNIAPLFKGADSQIVFGAPNSYSLRGLGLVHALELGARLVISSYSSFPEQDRLRNEDASQFVDDFVMLSYDRGTADPTIPFYGRRRFREADSFSLVSNGDGVVDLRELIYFSAYVYSIEELTLRLRARAEEPCKVDNTLDTMKWHRMDLGCFRRVFFGQADTLWDHEPRLLAYYHSLTPADQRDLETAIETGARIGGLSTDPVRGYEAQSFAAIIHFEESYFQRFDIDEDGRIQTDEALEAAKYHRLIISEIGGIDLKNTALLDGIYTYGVKHGKAPTRGTMGTTEMLAWLAIRPFWNLQATPNDIFRSIPLINIFPNP